MPTVIAIEAKPVEFEGIDSGFLHLYLVKTVTDELGRIVSEKVIRGTAGSNGDLETLVDADLATSPDRRGSESLEERHHKVLDLGTREAEDVWNVMVQHANNIEKADLEYSVDIFRRIPGDDLNSNSVVASVLHSVGLSLSTSLPVGVSSSEAPLYGQLHQMDVRDILRGTQNADRIKGGVENDSLFGKAQDDRLSGEAGNDRLSGHSGKDHLSGGSGDDRLYGGGDDDVLHGGSGRDAFVFTSVHSGFDTIRDFSVLNDTIWLENRVFTELGSAGRLRSSAFSIGNEARDATDRVIYDRDDGVLYYDPDGKGVAAQVAITKLKEGLKMTYADFEVI